MKNEDIRKMARKFYHLLDNQKKIFWDEIAKQDKERHNSMEARL